MKLVLFKGNGLPHHKNYDAIKRMCKSCSVEFEETTDIHRLQQNNYNILLTCNSYINPESIPTDIKIIFGPQFFVFPEGPIVGDRNEELSTRAVYNILSPWIKTTFLEFAHDFIVPMQCFPFAVNTSKFSLPSTPQDKSLDCIVYIKRRSNTLINHALSLLNQKGLKYAIFRYGTYNEEQYLTALKQAKFMLSLDAHESQGFALEEAMSTNVPLLVVDATSMYDETNNGTNPVYAHLKPKKLLATSVPYWSDECGIKITEQDDLPTAIDKMIAEYTSFTPREYILRTLSDEVCMRRILDYFKL
jgi:glycosyltransferase involved in cell wall biosynthesis